MVGRLHNCYARLDMKDGLLVWAAAAEGIVQANWPVEDHPLLQHCVQHMKAQSPGYCQEEKAEALMGVRRNSTGGIGERNLGGYAFMHDRAQRARARVCPARVHAGLHRMAGARCHRTR